MLEDGDADPGYTYIYYNTYIIKLYNNEILLFKKINDFLLIYLNI